jgi:hypothetical protein
VLLVNKDPVNPHDVRIDFQRSETAVAHFYGEIAMTTFGADQYQWHPDGAASHADPDGPPVHSTIHAAPNETIRLPRASITVLRGQIR